MSAPISVVLIPVALFSVLTAHPLSAAAGTIPESHAAILLAKCLPYNDEWEGRSSLGILVLAVGEDGQMATAEGFAGLLREVGTKIRKKDPDQPVLSVTTSTLRQFDVDTLASATPQLIYLVEGQGRTSRPLRNNLASLAAVAKRLGILVFTDSRSAYRDAASIYFALGKNNRPEIYGDLGRVRDQGGLLQGTFQRLLKKEARP